MARLSKELNQQFIESTRLEKNIRDNLRSLGYPQEGRIKS